LQQTIPPQWTGATVYVKFQAFNKFHSGGQDLATCVAYVFVPGGSTDPHPIATQLLTGTPVDLGSVNDVPTLDDDFGRVAYPAVGTVDLGTVP
jgi:hypothetical protein